MSGFRKATAEQAAIKMSGYGLQGSGKSFSSLLIAEGLAKLASKRIAYVDTEHGTDFYCKAVAERRVHPEAFDFDALYTKSLTAVLDEVRRLDFKAHGVIVIDQISHLWDAAQAAYTGKRTPAGTIPYYAWNEIKKPYKDLMNFLVNSPMHIIILGRQANNFTEDEETGEMKAAGVKMRAEKETQYEPHICLRFEQEYDKKKHEQTIYAFAEKDRSGVLQGKYIAWPNFEKIALPILPYLGHEQAQMESDADVAARDVAHRAGVLRQRKERIYSLLNKAKVAEKDAKANLEKKYGVDSFDDLTDIQAAEVIAKLEERIGKAQQSQAAPTATATAAKPAEPKAESAPTPTPDASVPEAKDENVADTSSNGHVEAPAKSEASLPESPASNGEATASPSGATSETCAAIRLAITQRHISFTKALNKLRKDYNVADFEELTEAQAQAVLTTISAALLPAAK